TKRVFLSGCRPRGFALTGVRRGGGRHAGSCGQAGPRAGLAANRYIQAWEQFGDLPTVGKLHLDAAPAAPTAYAPSRPRLASTWHRRAGRVSPRLRPGVGRGSDSCSGPVLYAEKFRRLGAEPLQSGVVLLALLHPGDGLVEPLAGLPLLAELPVGHGE